METNFKRHQDPRQSLGIGRFINLKSSEIINARACRANFSLEELIQVYDNIQSKKAIIDGQPINNISESWVWNNKIVNGIQAWRRLLSKEFMAKNKDKLFKLYVKGSVRFGYLSKVRRDGRLEARGTRYRFWGMPKHFIEATDKETIEYIKLNGPPRHI